MLRTAWTNPKSPIPSRTQLVAIWVPRHALLTSCGCLSHSRVCLPVPMSVKRLLPLRRFRQRNSHHWDAGLCQNASEACGGAEGRCDRQLAHRLVHQRPVTSVTTCALCATRLHTGHEVMRSTKCTRHTAKTFSMSRRRDNCNTMGEDFMGALPQLQHCVYHAIR